MIPSAFVTIDTLPMTPNGKIDRNALPVPETTRPELTDAFVAPKGPLEEGLAEIWQEVLKIDEVGVHDNFFELGGHSLLAIRVTSRIAKTFNVNLPLALFFDTPTIASMAPKIEAIQQTLAQQTLPNIQGDHYEEGEL
jgi:acyl carrier protein